MSKLLSGLRAQSAAVFGAGALVLGGVSAPAVAQDNSPMLTSSSTVTQQEREDLREANKQSRIHSQSGFNIAIVLHTGQDVPNARFASQEELGAVFRDHYQALLDEAYPSENGRVEVFYAPNPDTAASGMTIQTGDKLYEINNERYGRSDERDPALFDLRTAWNAAPEIVEHLPLAKAIQAENERAGYTTTASLEYSYPK